MPVRTVRRLLPIAALLGLTTGALPLLAQSAAADPPVIRYASPTGSGAACTSQLPCLITTAVNDAPAVATIEVEPGTYGSAGTPINQILDAFSNTLTIVGLGSPGPVIYSSGSEAIRAFTGSVISNLQINDSSSLGSGIELYGAVGNDLTVIAPDETACDLINAAALSNSVCWSDAHGYPALEAELLTNSTATLSGVTVVDDGSNGTGLQVRAEEDGITAGVVATNSIFRQTTGGDDIYANSQSGTTVTGTFNNCDYARQVGYNGLGGAVDFAGGNDLTAAPTFVSAATQNYREAPGSPTIDHGTAVAGNGQLDPDGHLRTIGSAPDIGAYESLEKPTATSLAVAKSGITKTTAKLKFQVGAGGAATTLTIRVLRTHHKTKVRTKTAGANGTPVAISYRVSGLKAHTSYRVKVTATNAIGSASTKSVKFTTRKPKHKHKH